MRTLLANSPLLTDTGHISLAYNIDLSEENSEYGIEMASVNYSQASIYLSRHRDKQV